MSQNIESFIKIQEELISLKSENHMLSEQLSQVSANSQSFLHSIFSGSEATRIESLQKEENELKRSINTIQEQIEGLKEQCLSMDKGVSSVDQIGFIETLFQTKKRELIRMQELNSSTLKDLEEEVELARELCESLESGRVSFARDKESIESSISSLQMAKSSIFSRISDLESLNNQLRDEIKSKNEGSLNLDDLKSQIREWKSKYADLENHCTLIVGELEAKEKELKDLCKIRASECQKIELEQQNLMASFEEQLKSLKKELHSLKSHVRSEETVEIDVESILQENLDLEHKLADLETKKIGLSKIVLRNQTDCSFLAAWLKREGRSRTDHETAFKGLIQIQCEKASELESLKNTGE